MAVAVAGGMVASDMQVLPVTCGIVAGNIVAVNGSPGAWVLPVVVSLVTGDTAMLPAADGVVTGDMWVLPVASVDGMVIGCTGVLPVVDGIGTGDMGVLPVAG